MFSRMYRHRHIWIHENTNHCNFEAWTRHTRSNLLQCSNVFCLSSVVLLSTCRAPFARLIPESIERRAAEIISFDRNVLRLSYDINYCSANNSVLYYYLRTHTSIIMYIRTENKPSISLRRDRFTSAYVLRSHVALPRAGRTRVICGELKIGSRFPFLSQDELFFFLFIV